jgi:hypothetical protein
MDNKKQLTCIFAGRLGNQLFRTAAAKKLAMDNDFEFIGMIRQHSQNDDSDEYIQKTVLRNVTIIDSVEPKEEWILYPKNDSEYLYNPNFIDIPSQRNKIILNSHFQKAKYIDEKIAFELFRPYDSIKKEIKELYGDLSNTVAIHIRRGDYVNIGWTVWNEFNIKQCVKEHFPNDKILIISDDLNWCKERFKEDQYSFADKPCTHPIEMDLYLQTQCRDNIVSNSTFSWWGAYLNENKNKKIIYPNCWLWFLPKQGLEIIPNDERWVPFKVR